MDENIKFNFRQMLGYGGLHLLAKSMQGLARRGEMDYNWFSGHLSDIGLPAAFTCFGLNLSKDFFKNNKYLNAASVLLPPVASTLCELEIFKIHPNVTTYDPQDIMCYFGGSLTAYGLSKAHEKKVFGKISNKVKSKFRKKSLEGAVGS